MDWRRPCGCTGGDGGCSYGGSWHTPCTGYPNCEYGVAEAKLILANREHNLPENKAKRERERKIKDARAAVTKAVRTAKELGISVTELGIKEHSRQKCPACGGSGFVYDDYRIGRVPCSWCKSTGYNDGQCCNDDTGLCCGAE